MPMRLFFRTNWDPVVVCYERIHVTRRNFVRPTRVEGTVGGPRVGPLPADMYPIALYPEAVGGVDPAGINPQDMPIGYHRGHIFGRALGGVNNPYNLVPMPSTINNGAWGRLEQALRDAHAQVRRQQRRIYFRADLGYANDLNAGDPTLPVAVRAWGYNLATIGAGGPGFVTNRTNALNLAVLGGAPNRVHYIAAPLNFANAAAQPFVFTRTQTTALNNVLLAYTNWANKPVVGGGNTNSVAYGGRGDPPAGTTMGPYAFLDVLEDAALGGALIAGLNAQFGAAVLPPNGLDYPANGVNKRNDTNINVGFTQQQKRLIRVVNWWNAAGRTQSDNGWYDQNRRLGLIEAQIDHIIPQANAHSSNYFWNAQMVSHAYNIMKGNQSEAAVHDNWMNAGVRGYGQKRKRHPPQYYTPYSKKVKR